MFFSKTAGTGIGSFHHGLGLVEINISDEAHELLADPDAVRKYESDTPRLFLLLLQLTSVLHERLHYIDTFGTIAGISLFAQRIAAIKRFVDVGFGLVESNLTWRLPLSEWARSADRPEIVRRFARYAESFRIANDIFVAPFENLPIEGHTTESWIEVPVAKDPNGKSWTIPAFPLSIGVQDEGGQIDPVTVLLPLGYEAILEGIAHSVARSYVERQFPSIPSALMEHYGPPKHFTVENPEEYLEAAAKAHEIYSATDFMISKFLRSKGVRAFPRNLVLQLSDIALSDTFIHVTDISDRSTRLALSSPGRKLVRAMSSTEVSRLKTASVEYPPTAQIAYQSFVDSASKGGDWDTVTDRGIPHISVSVWESYVAHHIILPLLSRRAETMNSCFTESSELLELGMRSDFPRVEVLNGQIRFEKLPEEVRDAWGQQLMLGEIAHQVLMDAPIIRCPRAHKMVPGLRTVDFSRGNCERYERLGCGSWTPGQAPYAPPCLFTQCLRMYGFLRATKQ